ncbi:MAG: hypothetical protein QS721_12935 [Candidatus Endonucleobacter sp. (ex Gigantidas childressi)]|nr:hypothetical protein [Candidatus Endonucleobacter sp. (ex Gigantidas childressi)]
MLIIWDNRLKARRDNHWSYNVDEDGFIKSTDYTAGNVHDSNCVTELLSGDESAAYADSAYRSQSHD